MYTVNLWLSHFTFLVIRVVGAFNDTLYTSSARWANVYCQSLVVTPRSSCVTVLFYLLIASKKKKKIFFYLC